MKPKLDGDGHAGFRNVPGSPTSSGKKLEHVKEGTFGYKISDSQSADELYDPNQKPQVQDGVFMTGRGAQGGGSKPTPQAQRMVTGSGTHKGSRTHMSGSYPKQTQKIRG